MNLIKSLLFFILLVSTSIARENPFVPVAHPGRILTTPDLRPTTPITPPEQNLSIKIDIVRKPPVKITPPVESPPPKPKIITLTPQIPTPPSTTNSTKKKITKPKVTPHQKPRTLSKKRIHRPPVPAQTYPRYRILHQNSYFTLKTDGERLFCQTKDPLIRYRILKHPYRLVLDFRRGNAFASVEKKIDTPYACFLWAGSHNDYYRIVVKMRPNKVPKISKKPNGCLITFKTIY